MAPEKKEGNHYDKDCLLLRRQAPKIVRTIAKVEVIRKTAAFLFCSRGM